MPSEPARKGFSHGLSCFCEDFCHGQEHTYGHRLCVGVDPGPGLVGPELAQAFRLSALLSQILDAGGAEKDLCIDQQEKPCIQPRWRSASTSRAKAGVGWRRLG
jgi:hypothetical protein